ncbi:hypothetical protein L210DRAFT_3644963 [Boletus edulis BED1]|uniref:F-box domain-containing protein n=1 Tax=Boletus edulis BED1 TaxID=1328754 RepID=A0AAD4BWF0_BOLED|nr:hypothetical protein L210DRAFT_3644963 [Boletus edulis BED1]
MHHALEIQEILLNVFSHLPPDDAAPELASLARTCRAFKEPALDVLWEELRDLSPLTRCLPETSHQLSPDNRKRSFSRPLTQIEWDILQSYTGRIRIIANFNWGLDEKSVEIFSNPPTTEPLFPNVRKICCRYEGGTMDLLRLPLPSLVSVRVDLSHPHSLQDGLQSFSAFSPNITTLILGIGDRSDVAFDKLVSNCICQWQNLQIVRCPKISLDAVALAHLSRMPVLSELSFKQTITFPNCISPLVFSNLSTFVLDSTSLGPISQLLSLILLPVIKHFRLTAASCPSRQELSSFLAAVHSSNADHTIEHFILDQLSHPGYLVRSEAPLLCFEHLQSCMAFGNLRNLSFDIEWNVGLTNNDLLALASAWPNLEYLAINDGWGWNTPDGITPNGLLQLLQTNPSLKAVSLVMGTRGYTEVPLGLTWPDHRDHLYIDVLDSIIEADSVPAITAFFAGITSCCKFVNSYAWIGGLFVKPPGWEVYSDRWEDIWRRAQVAIRPHS